MQPSSIDTLQKINAMLFACALEKSWLVFVRCRWPWNAQETFCYCRRLQHVSLFWLHTGLETINLLRIYAFNITGSVEWISRIEWRCLIRNRVRPLEYWHKSWLALINNTLFVSQRVMLAKCSGRIRWCWCVRLGLLGRQWVGSLRRRTNAHLNIHGWFEV